MARKTKAEAQETRARIMDAAIDVFYEKGVAAAALEDIAHVAGVTRGAIYWHFRNKSDLCLAIHHDMHSSIFTELTGRVERDDDILDVLEKFSVDMLRRLRTDEKFFKATCVFCLKWDYCDGLAEVLDAQHAKMDEALAYVGQLLRRERERGRVRSDYEPHIMALTLFSLVEGLMFAMLKRPDFFEDTHLTQTVSLLMRGMRADCA